MTTYTHEQKLLFTQAYFASCEINRLVNRLANKVGNTQETMDKLVHQHVRLKDVAYTLKAQYSIDLSKFTVDEMMEIARS